jgi:hypothetical protein
MKKLYSITIAAGLALGFSGCMGGTASTPSNTAVNECSVAENGIEKVLAAATKYNEIAIKHKVEYRRLGVNNSGLIDAINKAIKDGSKDVTPLDFKGKPTKDKFTVEYATQRACKFATSALSQEEEAKTTWKLAVPGYDNFVK